MHSHNRSVTLGLSVSGVLLSVILLAGCKPDYPVCDTDKDCKPKEFCVARKCQQCRDNGDCAEGQQCAAGKCSAIAGFCRDNAQCPAPQICIANRCRNCQSDTECASGQKCMQGACKKPQCTKDDDCAQDQDCLNGACVASAPKPPSGPPCPLASVYFGFNQSSLAGDASGTLNSNAECLKKANRPVNLVGRADPRGTTEYNMALSDRRAQSVKEHLQRLGIDASRLRPVPRGALDASGTDEASWAKDRRVDSEWQ